MMDRMEEITVELKSRMLASFLFVSSELGMWCFGPDKELFYSTCPNESEFKILLELGEVLDFLYEREDGWEKPVMLSDELGLVWVAEQMFRNGKPDLLFIMGPAFISNTSAKSIDEALQKKETSILMKRQISRFLTSVPVIIHPTLSVYIKMLHFVITGEQLDMLDIYYKNAKTHRISEQLGGGELD